MARASSEQLDRIAELFSGDAELVPLARAQAAEALAALPQLTAAAVEHDRRDFADREARGGRVSAGRVPRTTAAVAASRLYSASARTASLTRSYADSPQPVKGLRRARPQPAPSGQSGAGGRQQFGRRTHRNCAPDRVRRRAGRSSSLTHRRSSAGSVLLEETKSPSAVRRIATRIWWMPSGSPARTACSLRSSLRQAVAADLLQAWRRQSSRDRGRPVPRGLLEEGPRHPRQGGNLAPTCCRRDSDRSRLEKPQREVIERGAVAALQLELDLGDRFGGSPPPRRISPSSIAASIRVPGRRLDIDGGARHLGHEERAQTLADLLRQVRAAFWRFQSGRSPSSAILPLAARQDVRPRRDPPDLTVWMKPPLCSRTRRLNRVVSRPQVLRIVIGAESLCCALAESGADFEQRLSQSRQIGWSGRELKFDFGRHEPCS